MEEFFERMIRGGKNGVDVWASGKRHVTPVKCK